jgi:Uma2 family endonuclease
MLAESLLCPVSDLGPYRRSDYERLPDEPRHELLYGRLYLTPSPSLLHQVVASLLFRKLSETARSMGGILLTAPLDVALAEHTVVQPDLLYLSAERLRESREGVEGAPSLVIEITSPGSVRRDRGEKLRAYAEHGVAEYWIVDPAARQIEFLTNREGRFQVEIPFDGIYRSAVLPGISLHLVELWTELEQVFPR